MKKQIDPLDILFGGARRDRLVSRRPDGVLNIFDPVLAVQAEAANTEVLCVADSVVDLVKPRSARARVTWTDVRAVLIEQNRRLTEPRHVKALHERMRTFLLDHLDQEQDLTWLIGRSVAFALVPQIVDGLSEADLRLVKADQEARVRKFLKSEPIPIHRRAANFIRLQRATHIIAREVRRRLDGEGPAREDFLQVLLPFADRLGVRRIAYLVTTLLSAASVAPEATACCLVYAMHRYPEWRTKIELEMAAAEPELLYSLAMDKFPVTLRFIKEATRIWPFPFGVERSAARDLKLDGVELRKGERYTVSSYVLHHRATYWDNPDCFDPDRWLSPRKPATRGTYVPFGFPPRSCVGGAVAHAQLFLVCELFSRSFRVEMAAGASPRLKLEGIALPVEMTGTIRLPASLTPVAEAATQCPAPAAQPAASAPSAGRPLAGSEGCRTIRKPNRRK